MVYIEATLRYKADEQRQLRSKQQSLFEIDQPVAKLRVCMVVPNASAKSRQMYVTKNMRVPESSVIHTAFSSESEDAECGHENLSSWEHSSGTQLEDIDVYIEAKRVADRVVAIIQPA